MILVNRFSLEWETFRSMTASYRIAYLTGGASAVAVLHICDPIRFVPNGTRLVFNSWKMKSAL